MKRFAVFMWRHYSANGGLNDFAGSCDTLEDAKAMAGREHAWFIRQPPRTDFTKRPPADDTSWQIFDLETRTIVASSSGESGAVDPSFLFSDEEAA